MERRYDGTSVPSRVSVTSIHPGMKTINFPPWKLTLRGWVLPLAGTFIVAFFACARYTAKPCTFDGLAPTILQQARVDADTA